MPLSDRTRLIAPATARGKGRRPVNPPIERASTMLSDDPAKMWDSSDGPVYGLEGTGAARALRSAIADLEGAAETWLVPSGLAAVTAPLTALLRPGDTVLATDGCYGPSRRFLTRWLGARGITARFHPAEATTDQIVDMIDDRTRLLLIESPTSLTFDMVDVSALAFACRARGVLTAMDNAWGAGLAFRPLAHGVDVSIHPLTKYVAGHSDLLMGAISVSDPEIGRAVAGTLEDLGWHVSPDDAWLALRGLRTLPVRYAEQEKSARAVIDWLEKQPEVSRVLWPALPPDPGHGLWKRDYSGAASLFGVVMTGGTTEQAHAMLKALNLFGLGYSWGGFESLITHETPQLRRRAHPPALEGELLRLHVGLEDPADLIADLLVGLRAWRDAA